jgi:hypothetical protein
MENKKLQKKWGPFFNDFRRQSVDFLRAAISNDDNESQHVKNLSKNNIETHYKQFNIKSLN